MFPGSFSANQGSGSTPVLIKETGGNGRGEFHLDSCVVTEICVRGWRIPKGILLSVFLQWPGYTVLIRHPDRHFLPLVDFAFANYKLTDPCLQQHDWFKTICGKRRFTQIWAVLPSGFIYLPAHKMIIEMKHYKNKFRIGIPVTEKQLSTHGIYGSEALMCGEIAFVFTTNNIKTRKRRQIMCWGHHFPCMKAKWLNTERILTFLQLYYPFIQWTYGHVFMEQVRN